jgi:hypothetical protein
MGPAFTDPAFLLGSLLREGLAAPPPSAWKAMHQQPPHTPLCLSTSRAKSGHVASSRRFTVKAAIIASFGSNDIYLNNS